MRQLINAIERAKILADNHLIQLHDLPAEVSRIAGQAPANNHAANGDRLDAIERAHIAEVLRRTQGNKARAARALGVNRRSLYRLLEKYAIETDAAQPTDGNAVPTK